MHSKRAYFCKRCGAEGGTLVQPSCNILQLYCCESGSALESYQLAVIDGIIGSRGVRGTITSHVISADDIDVRIEWEPNSPANFPLPEGQHHA
jgi:hypothetical protein